MRYLAALLLIAVPTFAQDSKHPVSVQVIASWDKNHTAIIAVPAIPSQTQCAGTINGDQYSPTTINMNCATQPGNPSGAYESVDRVDVTSVVSIDSKPTMLITCSAHWDLSRCVPLSSGYYLARWADKKHTQLRLLVQFPSDKKAKEVHYSVPVR